MVTLQVKPARILRGITAGLILPATTGAFTIYALLAHLAHIVITASLAQTPAGGALPVRTRGVFLPTRAIRTARFPGHTTLRARARFTRGVFVVTRVILTAGFAIPAAVRARVVIARGTVLVADVTGATRLLLCTARGTHALYARGMFFVACVVVAAGLPDGAARCARVFEARGVLLPALRLGATEGAAGLV